MGEEFGQREHGDNQHPVLVLLQKQCRERYTENEVGCATRVLRGANMKVKHQKCQKRAETFKHEAGGKEAMRWAADYKKGNERAREVAAKRHQPTRQQEPQHNGPIPTDEAGKNSAAKIRSANHCHGRAKYSMQWRPRSCAIEVVDEIAEIQTVKVRRHLMS